MFNSSFANLGHPQPKEDPFLVRQDEEVRQPNFQFKTVEQSAPARYQAPQKRTSISPNIDSLLYNNTSTTASIDLNISNFANTSAPALSFTQFGQENIGKYSHDFSPKGIYQNTMLKGFFESVNLPFEEEIKHGVTIVKAFNPLANHQFSDQNNFGSGDLQQQQAGGSAPSIEKRIQKSHTLMQDVQTYPENVHNLASLNVTSNYLSGNYLLGEDPVTPVGVPVASGWGGFSLPATDLLGNITFVRSMPQLLVNDCQEPIDNEKSTNMKEEEAPENKKKRDAKRTRKSLERNLFVTQKCCSQPFMVHKQMSEDQLQLETDLQQNGRKVSIYHKQQNNIQGTITAKSKDKRVRKPTEKAAGSVKLFTTQNMSSRIMQIQTNTQIISELIGNKRDSTRCLKPEKAHVKSTTFKKLKSFGVGVSETQSSSVLKFKEPFNIHKKMQSDEGTVNVSSRSGRKIKKNHYNDDEYFYPQRASVPPHKTAAAKLSKPPQATRQKDSNNERQRSEFPNQSELCTQVSICKVFGESAEKTPDTDKPTMFKQSLQIPQQQMRKANIAIPLFRKVEDTQEKPRKHAFSIISQQSPQPFSTAASITCAEDENFMKPCEELKENRSSLHEIRDSFRDLLEDQFISPNDSSSSSSSDDEEMIDDEIFIKRHLQLEIDEIRRYNIGVQQHYQGAQKAIEQRISTLIETANQKIRTLSRNARQTLIAPTSISDIEGQNIKRTNPIQTSQNELNMRGYNLRRNPAGKQQDKDFLYA